jgi:hypothetical protein
MKYRLRFTVPDSFPYSDVKNTYPAYLLGTLFSEELLQRRDVVKLLRFWKLHISVFPRRYGKLSSIVWTYKYWRRRQILKLVFIRFCVICMLLVWEQAMKFMDPEYLTKWICFENICDSWSHAYKENMAGCVGTHLSIPMWQYFLALYENQCLLEPMTLLLRCHDPFNPLSLTHLKFAVSLYLQDIEIWFSIPNSEIDLYPNWILPNFKY